MTGALSPVPRETFGGHVLTGLRRAILTGELPPGAPVTETALARRFAVSRGPIREAMAQLAAEGLLDQTPFKGTRVIALSSVRVREIYSLRAALEGFAFREIWDRRGADFAAELRDRHAHLLETLSLHDPVASSAAELRLHGLVYEACGHHLLLETWDRLAGRLQVYLAAHQRAHGRTGPDRAGHQAYVDLALGDDLHAMLAEIEEHTRRGAGRVSEG